VLLANNWQHFLEIAMNNEELKSICKKLVDKFVAAILRYVAEDHEDYLVDDMLLADMSVCITGKPSSTEEPLTLRRFIIRIGSMSYGDNTKHHEIEGFAPEASGIITTEDIPVSFDDILEDNNEVE
jgi:hypothetical protein